MKLDVPVVVVGVIASVKCGVMAVRPRSSWLVLLTLNLLCPAGMEELGLRLALGNNAKTLPEM
jgi:hypothetical protein